MHQGNRPQYFWNICFSFCLLVFLTFCIVIIQHHCLKVKSLTTIIKKIVLKRNSSQEDKSQSSQIVTKLRRFEESYCAAALSAASSVSLLSFHLSFFSNSIWCKYIFIHFDFSLPSGVMLSVLSVDDHFYILKRSSHSNLDDNSLFAF